MISDKNLVRREKESGPWVNIHYDFKVGTGLPEDIVFGLIVESDTVLIADLLQS